MEKVKCDKCGIHIVGKIYFDYYYLISSIVYYCDQCNTCCGCCDRSFAEWNCPICSHIENTKSELNEYYYWNKEVYCKFHTIQLMTIKEDSSITIGSIYRKFDGRKVEIIGVEEDEFKSKIIYYQYKTGECGKLEINNFLYDVVNLTNGTSDFRFTYIDKKITSGTGSIKPMSLFMI
jgi:hypothetical protein